jgi:hypothetical protein
MKELEIARQMKLTKVNPTPSFRFKCIRCKTVYHSTIDAELFHNVYADLDGDAFVDYYCDACLSLLPGGKLKECED